MSSFPLFPASRSFALPGMMMTLISFPIGILPEKTKRRGDVRKPRVTAAVAVAVAAGSY